jgi:Family of unknown function (DUF6157)
MKTHTTNYFNTFIEVADDCPTQIGETPLAKSKQKSVAEMQFELVANHPYRFTSDEVFFQVYADKNDVPSAEYAQAREQFFSKGQPCFRASPLPKRYGFGVHSDAEGKVAIYGRETEDYQRFLQNDQVKKVKAMRTAKEK